jgi:ribosome maturation factor RimP
VSTVSDELYDLLSPLLATVGLQLFDVQVSSRTIAVTVDRPGGVDLDALAEANRVVGAALDEQEPIAGPYTLEVSSPGLERRLRTPAHFEGAVGEEVTVRTLAGVGEHRRVHGLLAGVDDAGIVLRGPEVPGGELAIPFGSIERARTVFEWGSGSSPSPSSGTKGPAAGKRPGGAKNAGGAKRAGGAKSPGGAKRPGGAKSAGGAKSPSAGKGPGVAESRKRVAGAGADPEKVGADRERVATQ